MLFAMCGLASAQVTLTWTASEQGYDNAQDFDGVTVQLDNVISAAFSKGSGSTTPKYYNTGTAMRLYGGNTMTLSGANIMNVVLTYDGSNSAEVTASTGEYSLEGSTGTWTGEASSVTFSRGGTSGHARIKTIEVTYSTGDVNPNYVAAPRISPATGTYYEAQTVTITAGDDCTIFYTTDGYSPVDATGGISQTAQAYSEPFTVAQTTTVKAVAMKATPAASFFSDVAESVITIAEAAQYASVPRMKAAAQNLGTDKQVCEMNTNGLTIIGAKGSNLYVVDYTGEGILLYGTSNLADGMPSTDLAVGDVIGGTIRGELQLYRGAVELGSIDLSSMTRNQQGVSVQPTAATIAELTGDNRLHYESGLVTVSGLSFTASALASKNITAKDATGAEIVVRDNYGVLADYPFSTSATYDITAIVAYYNGAVQLYPRTADEVVKVGGGDDPEPQPHQLVGDGTLQNPYTVEDINSMEIPYTTDEAGKKTYGNANGDAKVWVKAQVIGFANGAFSANKVVFGTSEAVQSNIVIIDEANVSVTAAPDIKYCAPVALANSSNTDKAIRAALNLADNPSLLSQTVYLYGDITMYFSVNGVKNLEKYSLDGTTILPADDEPGPDPGTDIDWTSSADAPLTVAQAMEKGGQLAPKADSGVDVYVKGFVANVEAIANGSAKYYIADQAAGNATQLYIYNGKGLQGADIAEGGLTQGDEVIVVGRVKNYQNNDGTSTIEMTGSKLYSLNGQTTPGDDPATDIDWTSSADAPLTVATALEKAEGLAASAEGSEIYVKGYVTSIEEINTQYGNATYYIADQPAGNSTQLYVYRGKSIDGAYFTSANDLAVGDELLLLGKMKNYVNNEGASTLELVSSKIVSRNGQTEPTPVETVSYASLPEMRAAARQLTVAKQDCELNTNGLTVIGVKNRNVYVVDYTGEGGLLLYGDNTLSLTVGQTIGGTLKGKLQMYNGVAELGDVDYSGMSVITSQPVTPVEATIADIATDFVKYESGLVIVKGLNFGDATAFAQNTTAYDESDNEIVVRDNYGTYAGETITPGADYDVTAIVALYNDAPQLYPRSIDDIVKTGEADLQVPTSEWSSDNVFCGPDEVVNVQFTTNSDGAVTYTSSDENVATVDANGVITTHAVGTATITATTAATATYRSSSDWVNIIVSDNSQGSKTNPYSPADIIARGADAEKVENVWVRGFIVGYVNGQSLSSGAVFFRTANEAPATRADVEVSNTNLLIAVNVEETNVENCIPVQLPAGDVRSSLNLRDHPELAYAEVELYGDVEKYFGVAGFKGVKAYEIIGGNAVRGINADTTTDAAIYTIDGRRVSAASRPGLYIIGGRKVAVK